MIGQMTLNQTENRQNAAQFSVVGLAELSEHTLLLNGLFSKPGGWSLGLNYCCCIRLLRIYLFKSSSFLILQHTKSFLWHKEATCFKTWIEGLVLKHNSICLLYVWGCKIFLSGQKIPEWISKSWNLKFLTVN